MTEVLQIINKHFRRAWFFKSPVCISTPSELADDIEQHILKAREVDQKKIDALEKELCQTRDYD